MGYEAEILTVTLYPEPGRALARFMDRIGRGFP